MKKHIVSSICRRDFPLPVYHERLGTLYKEGESEKEREGERGGGERGKGERE